MEGVGLGEIDGDFLGGQLIEDLGHCLQLALGFLSVEGVEEELHVLLAVEGNSSLSASNC